MAIPGSNDLKKQLRTEMRRLLATPFTETNVILSKVRDWLGAHSNLRTISLYSPLPGEIDLTSLVTDFKDIRWVFPRVEGSELVMHHVSDLRSGLEPGFLGIAEPKTSLEAVSFHEIDAFICPGLAFDEYGGRLGRGRGFYDRMLANARGDAWKIGVCREEQIVPDVFGEPHDVVMDEVIS